MSSIDYSPRSIAKALRSLNSHFKLGAHSLAQASFVTETISNLGGLDDQANRGIILAHFLTELIERNKDSEVGNIDWRILYDHMILEKTLKQISYELDISQRTASRYFLRACETLGKVLVKQGISKADQKQRPI